jgi:general secretion pathway protein H
MLCLSEHRTSNPRCDTGFTLLEMLIVITILAILLAVVPSAMNGLPTIRLRAAAAMVAEALRQAHDDAIRTGSSVDVSFDAERRAYKVQGAPLQYLPPMVDSMYVLKAGPLGRHRMTVLQFFADGSATGAAISLGHGHLRTVIGVEWLAGRVQVDE